MRPSDDPTTRATGDPATGAARTGRRVGIVEQLHYAFVDHALLRIFWTNFDRVAEGVYRSNHPGPRRLRRYRDRGIRAILNLRGDNTRFAHDAVERAACGRLGLGLEHLHLRPNRLPDRRTLATLEHHLRTLPRPFLMHCRSGADRAGFVAALYLLLIEGAPVEVAARQLSLRYLHFRASRKGVFDYCLETYRQRNEASPIAFRDWLMSEYDPDALLVGFNKRRGARDRG